MGRSRVLIVDDSSLSREVLRRVLERDPHLQVAGEARTGEEAVALVRALQPHLVTMDLNMPGMGGLKAIEVLMRERPTPIVVISERSSTSGVDLNSEALSRGALELVPKSAVFGAGDAELGAFVARLRALAEAGLAHDEQPVPVPFPATPAPASTEPPRLLGIGASTGGPRALARVLSSLPRGFPLPIAVVQHMADDFFDSFARFLRDASGHPVVPVQPGTRLEPGAVYLAPPRQELLVREDLGVRLMPPPPNAIFSPTVDSLFFSMATALKGRGLGVLLTGMGDDGAQGLLRLRRMGARTIAQDRATSAVYGMPRAALELGAAAHVLPLPAIAPFLVQVVVGAGEAPPPPRPSPGAPPRDMRRVLVLDDQPRALEEARATLSGHGFEVLALDNPLMLAGTLRRNTVDVVVLEPELSTMKGAVVVQTLRAHGFDTVPIGLWSAADEATLRQRRAECRAQGTARKSDPAGLLRLVRALVAHAGGG